MAVAVKDAAASAKKFVTNAQNSGAAYTAGVSNAGAKWMAKTKEAAPTWAQGVADAASNGRFGNGINSAAMNKFQTRASTVGPSRFTTGVASAADAWAQNTQPYLNTIAALNLPARGVKGAPQNYQRIQVIGDALRAKKLQGGNA